MKLLLVTDHIFTRFDGKVYDDFCFGRAFFDDYLKAFDEVTIVSRARSAPATAIERLTRSDGPGLKFIAIPPIRGGAWIPISRILSLLPSVRSALQRADAVIIRTPSELGWWIARLAMNHGKPFMLEVIGDPEEAITQAGTGMLLRGFAKLSSARLKKLALHADCVSYVNEQTLPERYPTRPRVPWEAISSIRLPEADILSASRSTFSPKAVFRLGYVGTLTPRKRVSDLLSAASIVCSETPHAVHIDLIGEGPERHSLEKQAGTMKSTCDVKFHGQISGWENIASLLDKLDALVFPSASEGLPRAVIEAMARGVPVLGSDAQGVNELVRAEDSFHVGDFRGIAKLIMDIRGNRERLSDMSSHSIKTARKFSDVRLTAARLRLYRSLCEKAAMNGTLERKAFGGDATIIER